MANTDFLSKIKERWNDLKPEQKKKIALIAMIGCVVLLGLVVEHMKSSTLQQEKEKAMASRATAKKEISTEARVINKSQVTDMQTEVDTLKGDVTGVKSDIGDIKKMMADLVQEKAKQQKQAASAPQLPGAKNSKQQAAPPLPFLAQGNKQSPASSFPQAPPPPPISQASMPGQHKASVEYVGDIEFLPGSPTKHEAEKDDKKKRRKIYLPSGSFFKATIIVGGSAETSENGKGEPEPILLRVKDIAILPNDVKARMEGCFFTGEMVGSLAKSCAKARIVNFSCIDKKGNALIDQRVPGYVADENGGNCIKGDTYWRAGNLISRTLLVSLLGGAGSALQAATVANTTVYPIGSFQTSSVPWSKAFEGGAGQNVKQGTDDIKGVLVNLMKNMSPAIDIGSVRDVTVVVKEGTELEIKDFVPSCGGVKCGS